MQSTSLRKHFRWSLLWGVFLLGFQNCTFSEFVPLESASSVSSAAAITDANFLKGEALYTKNCQNCHGPLATSSKSKADVARITQALSTQSAMLSLKPLLSTNDVELIAYALQGPPVSASKCDANVVGHLAAHRLSHHEYNNVIRDLTGLDTKPAAKFPDDPFTGFFTNRAATLGVDQSLMTLYFESALQTLDNAFAVARGNIVTCNPVTAGERACADKIIREFGMKAFRRPLSALEVQKYLSLFDKTRQSFPAGASGSAFDESLKASLQAILVSTNFIYRIVDMPNSDPSLVKALGSYEVASRLSFFLWGSIPDATLFSLAASGQILDKTILAQQVDRMLKDPKANYLVEVFGTQWLKLYKLGDAKPDVNIYPMFNETLRSAMLTESKLLLGDILQKDGSPFLVLNANYTYINSTLGAFYGLAGATDNNFTKVTLTNTPRVGVLTHGSILTANSRPVESSIVHRGLWVLDRILCSPVGSAPADVKTELPVDFDTTNPRLSLSAHVNNSACVSCHSQIDPAGFGLENFDGIGKFRTRYRNGDAIDASGSFPGGTSFTDSKQLSEAMVKDPKFPLCYARNVMTFSLGRVLTNEDTCAADTFGARSVTPNGKFSDLVKQIVTSEQFLKQKGGN